MTPEESLERFGTILLSTQIMANNIKFDDSCLVLDNWLAMFSFYKEPRGFATALGFVFRMMMKDNMLPVKATQASKAEYIYRLHEFYLSVPHRCDNLRNELAICRRPQ
jgi:hypothetical protein